MCLAMPAEIIAISGDDATVDAMGNQFKAKTTLLADVEVGDIVLVHAGFAIAKIDRKEAQQTWQLFDEMAQLAAAEDNQIKSDK